MILGIPTDKDFELLKKMRLMSFDYEIKVKNIIKNEYKIARDMGVISNIEYFKKLLELETRN